MPRTSKKNTTDQQVGSSQATDASPAPAATTAATSAKPEAGAAKTGPARKRKRTRHGKSKDDEGQAVTATAEKTPEVTSAPVTTSPAKSAASASASTNGQTGGTKRKRTRRRNRRTTAAASESDDSSSSDSSSDDEEPPKKPVVTAARSLSSSSSSSSSSDESSDSDLDSNGKQSKPASRREAPKPTAAQPTGDQLGPVPDTLQPTLSEQTRRGLAYAQQFARDRTSWKFQKQRQNWLLRHALDIDTDSITPSSEGDTANGNAQPGKDGEDDDDDGPVRIPRAYSRVLAWYFANMLGGAKVRVIADLREAANATVIEDETKLVESSASSDAARPGSFSLGNLAMQKEAQEQKDADAAAGGDAGPKVPDQSEIKRKKEAARELLSLMGETV
ncbi:hypothetical protein OC846_001866 [Tilletia horrida]|uniref:WKF domain-containing protein n=1 Tax=Tilletia horrida TaxID=155126 RepID=A0AAN6GS38_9BASI|nr:hypothetical protein OC846_001866 [Tilletia horrida]KAK0568383.1 hypothetical protein OC861_002012 [Tilletia horrida]